MALYSVYARNGAVPVLVADRFSWFAALLPPVYAIVHGLWLGLGGWIVAVVVLGFVAIYVGEEACFWLYVLFSILIGFEAPTLRRLNLGRSGFGHLGEVVAADEDVALGEVLRRR